MKQEFIVSEEVVLASRLSCVPVVSSFVQIAFWDPSIDVADSGSNWTVYI